MYVFVCLCVCVCACVFIRHKSDVMIRSTIQLDPMLKCIYTDDESAVLAEFWLGPTHKSIYCNDANLTTASINRRAFWLSEHDKGLNSAVLCVDLSSNHIGHVEDTWFEKLTSLQYLLLSDNLLVEFTIAAINNNKLLQTIHLQGNSLASIRLNFGAFPNLGVVDVSNNMLETFPEATFREFLTNKDYGEYSRELYLDTNLLGCQCDMAWVVAADIRAIVDFGEDNCTNEYVVGYLELECIFNINQAKCNHRIHSINEITERCKGK